MIAAQVELGQVLGIPAEQIANGEFFARATSSSNWDARASTSTPSADPDPSVRRTLTRVEVPNIVIVPDVSYYNPVHNSPSILSPAPNIAAGWEAPDPGTPYSIPSPSPQLFTGTWRSTQFNSRATAFS